MITDERWTIIHYEVNRCGNKKIAAEVKQMICKSFRGSNTQSCDTVVKITKSDKKLIIKIYQ